MLCWSRAAGRVALALGLRISYLFTKYVAGDQTQHHTKAVGFCLCTAAITQEQHTLHSHLTLMPSNSVLFIPFYIYDFLKTIRHPMYVYIYINHEMLAGNFRKYPQKALYSELSKALQ